MTLADLSALPPVVEQRGGHPDLVADELMHVIKQRITNHPRSKQRRIGPSELGTDCARRIAYKLAGVDEVNPREGAWKPTVGTAVHSWLEETFVFANRGHQSARFLVETRVEVGQVGGQTITGSIDLYDRITATVIDWKVVGASSLKTKKVNGPGNQYRSQIHLYARGLAARGLPVDTVMIAFLPQNADLHTAHIWHEPYDEQVALDALARADAIAGLVDVVGASAAAALPTADAWCQWCPFYLPAATELSQACPGHVAERETPTQPRRTA